MRRRWGVNEHRGRTADAGASAVECSSVALGSGYLVWVDQTQLAACRGLLREDDCAVEDLGVKKRLHQLVVRAVSEGLRFVVDRLGEVGGVRGQFGCGTAGEDFSCCPMVYGVGGGLDFKHSEGHVFGRALSCVSGSLSGALELAELASAFVDGDRAGFGVELCFGALVAVLAGDLTYPAGVDGA
jgi:hypothetical protein